jgi:hypothetical protein
MAAKMAAHKTLLVTTASFAFSQEKIFGLYFFSLARTLLLSFINQNRSTSCDKETPEITESGPEATIVSPLLSRVARFYIFKPKLLFWVNLGGSCNGRCWYILWPFGIFYG